MSAAILTCFCCQTCSEPLKLPLDVVNSLKAETVYSELLLSDRQHGALQQSQPLETGTAGLLGSPSIHRPSTANRPSAHSITGVNTLRRPTTSGASYVSRLSVHSAKPHRSMDQFSALSMGAAVTSLTETTKFPLSFIPHLSDSETQNGDIVDSNEQLIDRLRQLAMIFDLLSSKSTHTDYPVCCDCAEMLDTVLKRELDQLSTDKETFAEFVKNVENTLAAPSTEDHDGMSELERLKSVEHALLQNLGRVESEHCAIMAEIEELELEASRLDDAEEALWLEHAVSEETLSSYQLENESMNNKYEKANALLEHLKKTNVYNDAFHIWHEGSFGTINGLRLGRLPDSPVEWIEINAGLGYACLMLDVLAQKSGFRFETFRLIPDGSQSSIERVDEQKSQLDLFGSGEFQLSRIFWNRRFDQGLAAFLDCVRQLGVFAQSQDREFKFPYAIEKDQIGGISIKSQFNQDDKWTRALKYLLTDLKWLLAFCTRKGHYSA